MISHDIALTIRVYVPDEIEDDVETAASGAFGKAIGTGGLVLGNIGVGEAVEAALRTALGRQDIWVRACVSDHPDDHEGVTCPAHERPLDPDEDVRATITETLAQWAGEGV